MTWQDLYFGCFLVGFALSCVSFLLGSVDFHFHFGGHDFNPIGHLQAHAGHDLSGGHGGAGNAGADGAHAANGGDPEISWFNFGTVTAFLAWFGGTGYLLSRFSGWLAWFSFGVAVVAGIAGGAIMFWFVAKVLMKHDSPLDPMDYDMIGVLGMVTVPIREGGTGEIVFSQEGSRRCAGARSETSEAIAKGEEVVVTRYEKGIAYVRLWEEMANGVSAGSSKEN
jgi:membrane protein implicated in regulation of membrane protease activity